MNLTYYLIIFLFGLTIGSFLNVVIIRLPNNEAISGRSNCPNCKTVLKWHDLFPLFSFFILLGKCRYCKKKISFQYPLIELVTGLLFVFIFYLQLPFLNGFSAFNFQNLLSTFYYLFIGCLLIVIFVSDLKNYIIPDIIVYIAIFLALIFDSQFLITKQFSVFFPLIFSALGLAGFFLVIFLISKGKWIGLGDVKLAFLMGLLLGWPYTFLALFFAVFLGAIIGVILIILSKKSLKSEIPFGPFLVIGTFFSLFYGQGIINWYFNLFF